MPLLPSEPSSSAPRRPWRAVLLCFFAVLVFVAGTALVARVTADGAPGIPPEMRAPDPDAGFPDAGHIEDIVDAGDDDAGELAPTVENEPDAGVLVYGAAAPPVSAADVALLATPLV